MGVEPLEGGQQGRVDVEHPSLPARHEPGREQAHEPGEADDVDRLRLELGLHGALERLAIPAEARVIDDRGGQMRLARGGEPFGVRAIGEHERDLGGIVGGARRRDQRPHVGAASGDQDRDAPPAHAPALAEVGAWQPSWLMSRGRGAGVGRALCPGRGTAESAAAQWLLAASWQARRGGYIPLRTAILGACFLSANRSPPPGCSSGAGFAGHARGWRPDRGLVLNLPNLITVARILMVPVVVWAIAQRQMQIAFLLFLAAGVSDAIDGFLAKRFGMASELGAHLDPLADKALIVSIYVALGITEAIPRWVVILVGSRDILIVGGVMFAWFLGKPMKVKPLLVSKLNTGAQIVFACLVLAALAFAFAGPLEAAVQAGVMWLVAALPLLAVAFYTRDWWRHMNAGEAGAG